MKAFQEALISKRRPPRGLLRYANDPKSIVLTLPDGLVPASTLSRALRIPLEVFFAQDLRAPCPCPCVIGVLTESGVVHLNQEVIARQHWLHRELRAYIDREIQLRQAEIDAKRQSLRAGRRLPDLTGRNVLFVEDRMSSTAKLLASVESVRNLGAKQLVTVVPAEH